MIGTKTYAPEQRAEALVEALPYIKQFQDAVIVVKYGGSAMADPELATTFAEDIVLLRSVGMRPVVVHGGGPQIGHHLKKLGKETRFQDGLRVTDAETLDIVRMILVGKIGRDIVGAINVHGAYAVGLSGEDGGMITAEPFDESLGLVGRIVSVQPGIIERLLAENMIPVISTIGSDRAGQAYNINADTVAGALAAALHAEKVIYLTDVPGLLADPSDPDTLIRKTSVAEVEKMLKTAAISSGMIPKLQACVDAIRGGTASAHMLDGTIPHVLLLELLTDTGIGTMVGGDQR